MKQKISFNLIRLLLVLWISSNIHSATAQTNVINFSFTPSVDISVFNDVNQNCILFNELGIAAIPVIIQPGNFIANSNNIGIASFTNLPNGTYTAFIDTLNLNWSPTCVNSQTFQVNNGTKVSFP